MSEACGTVVDMENGSELLMTTGTMALCPDCDTETLFVVIEEGEHCCTVCDAAVFLLDQRGRVSTASTARTAAVARSGSSHDTQVIRGSLRNQAS